MVKRTANDFFEVPPDLKLRFFKKVKNFLEISKLICNFLSKRQIMRICLSRTTIDLLKRSSHHMEFMDLLSAGKADLAWSPLSKVGFLGNIWLYQIIWAKILHDSKAKSNYQLLKMNFRLNLSFRFRAPNGLAQEFSHNMELMDHWFSGNAELTWSPLSKVDF